MTTTSPYQEHKGKLCVMACMLIGDMISMELYKKWCRLHPEGQLKKGGNGRKALFDLRSVPEPYYSQILAKYGNPEAVSNPLEPYYSSSAEAKTFYDGFRFEDDSYLSPEQIRRYTLNASVLNALGALEQARRAIRGAKGNKGAMRNLWEGLASDCTAFNEVLHTKYGVKHTLPSNSLRLREKLRDYQKRSYTELIHKNNNNTNAQVVTPLMLQLWRDIYAGQRGYKPTYTEVYVKYQSFRAGLSEIINTDTGEAYDRHNEDFRDASESTVYNRQAEWANRIITHAMRSGDRQRFSAQMPFHKLKQPEYAGSIISVDDRQPPFEYAPGKRMWFYNAIDLGSEAFTCWVWGETKEGIIIDFYRQMVRNYTEWGFNLPYELEGEMSLNSSFVNTFLQNGAMFQHTRIEANNARGKRIEAYYRPLRYNVEKKREGWLARPFALGEANQLGPEKKVIVPKDTIVMGCLRDIETWNNTLHSDQELHPGMTRWDVFEQRQHANLTPTNWSGILPHLGYLTQTSMKAGRIMLKGKHRVVGHNGNVALGDDLIRIMSKIEGQTVNVYWLDGNDGQVMKALVYGMQGTQICELLGDLAYSRSLLERTEQDEINRTLTSAYAATVQGYISRGTKQVNPVTIIETEPAKPGRFRIKAVEHYVSNDDAPVIAPHIEEEDTVHVPTDFNIDTASRF